MTVNVIADAVRAARAALHQLRIPGGVAAAGVCHPARRVRRHLAQAGRDEQRVHRLVPAAARHLQHVVAGLRRLSTTRCSTAASCSCHDAKTGKQIYGRQRISPEAERLHRVALGLQRQDLPLSEDGDTFVVQAGPEFKVLGKNSLNEMALATPAVVRGSLIIRTQSKLYRIAKNRQNDDGRRTFGAVCRGDWRRGPRRSARRWR